MAVAILERDEVRSRREIVVGARVARAVARVDRHDARHVPVVAAIGDARLRPGDELLRPPDAAVTHVEGKDRVHVVVRRVAGRSGAAAGDAREVCRSDGMAVVVPRAGEHRSTLPIHDEVAAPDPAAAVARGHRVGLPCDLPALRAADMHGDDAAPALAADESRHQAGEALLVRGDAGEEKAVRHGRRRRDHGVGIDRGRFELRLPDQLAAARVDREQPGTFLGAHVHHAIDHRGTRARMRVGGQAVVGQLVPPGLAAVPGIDGPQVAAPVGEIGASVDHCRTGRDIPARGERPFHLQLADVMDRTASNRRRVLQVLPEHRPIVGWPVARRHRVRRHQRDGRQQGAQHRAPTLGTGHGA